MDHFVTLDSLPDGFAVPDQFRDRLSFDPASRRLVFHGFMSKSDYDQLFLAVEDWPFRRKLEELFQLCTYEDGPRPTGLRRLFGAFAHRPRH